MGAALTLGQPLPVYPEQRTTSDRPGWSGSCQERTHAVHSSQSRTNTVNHSCIVPVDPRDRFNRPIGTTTDHLSITFLLRWPIRQVEADLVTCRHCLNLRRSRQTNCFIAP